MYQKIKPMGYPEINDPAMKAIIFLLPISIISHVMFNVPTELNYKLGISRKPIKLFPILHTQIYILIISYFFSFYRISFNFS